MPSPLSTPLRAPAGLMLRIPTLAWLLLFAASCIVCGLAWLQTQATVTFQVRSATPVHLQVFYSKAGNFSETDSVRVVAMPSKDAGEVSIRIPAARANVLRIDPRGASPGFDVCGLRTDRSQGNTFQETTANQLTFSETDACTRLLPDQASTDPFLVMSATAPPSRFARVWRWLTRISVACAAAIIVLLAIRAGGIHTAWSQRADALYRSVTARIHWLALVMMVMMGSLIAHALPPNGIPDEIAHLSKIAKVSSGVLFSDSGAVPVVDVFSMYANMNDVREPAVIDPQALSTALSRPVACARAERTLPTMADSYAPHLYAAPALVLSASCGLHTSFGNFLKIARIVNLLLAAGLIAIGIRYAVLGKWSLVAVGLLPMTLAQVASVSADSLTLSLSFCFIGLVSGIAGGSIRIYKLRYWLPLLALAIAFAKPGSAWILIAILFCRHAYIAQGRSFKLGVATVLVIPWIVHAAWVVLSASGAKPLAGVDPQSNLALLQSNPLQVATLGFNTFFGAHGEFIYKSTVGLLGWLDIPLSTWAYGVAGIALIGSLWANDRLPRIPLWVRALAVSAAIGSMAMLSLPLYLYWTDPAHGIVMGLQGRYFLPTLAFLLVWVAMQGKPIVRACVMACILAMPVLTLDAVRHINDRYYLIGL